MAPQPALPLTESRGPGAPITYSPTHIESHSPDTPIKSPSEMESRLGVSVLGRALRETDVIRSSLDTHLIRPFQSIAARQVGWTKHVDWTEKVDEEEKEGN